MKHEGRRHVLIIVSENILDVNQFAKDVEKATGFESRATILGHLQRGGTPSAMDRVTGTILGYKALELLISRLKEKGKLEETVIVLLADHYPYKLDINQINEASSYKRDAVVEVNHNSLIIWNSEITPTTIDKVCMSIDVIPTVYNLFNIPYDSRLIMGKDIFSTTEGIAIMKNRSWVTNKGTYYSSSKKFVPTGEPVSEDYISLINQIVSNRLSISKMIVSNNYYKSITIKNK
jgi:phosphoglycerol transferase MdoB-like AlkP superfamily enzyme